MEASFATISEVFGDGVTLRFDGLDAPTTKRYKVNAFVVFRPGDRVRVIKDAGTYVVEYPVGNPRTVFTADSATRVDHATAADHATSADSATQVTGAVSRANSAGSLLSGGNGAQIFLISEGGNFYIASQGGSARRIVTQ